MRQFRIGAIQLAAVLSFMLFSVTAHANDAGRPETVYEFVKGLETPKLLQAAKVRVPEYMHILQDADCVITLVVTSQGTPANIFVLQPVGAEYDAAAIDAVANSKFQPAYFKKHPVTSRIYLHVTFYSDNSKVPTLEFLLSGKGAITQPKLLHEVNPVAPRMSREQALTGSVGVGFVIDSTGQPIGAHVFDRLREDYDAEAIKAVNQFHYRPATIDGKPTAAPASVYVHFSNLF